jgi:glyoxylase-like metal-dependent hydrolase (beta-lactamase superfamily II)
VETGGRIARPEGGCIYRIEAEAQNSFGISSGTDPLAMLLSVEPTPTTRRVIETFSGKGAPVAPSSFRVACHIVSLPEFVLVVDSTFSTTASEVFPDGLEAILRTEGTRLSDRPLFVLYTHAHVDHAGGYQAVEAIGEWVTTMSHPYTRALHPCVGRIESFLSTKAHFFRDCGFTRTLEDLRDEVRDRFYRMLESAGIDLEAHPYGASAERPIRIDVPVPATPENSHWLDGRVEILRFDGHTPGHVCVRIDREHLITGDMWLPATTSTVTPGTIAEMAGIGREECGIVRYIESSERLLKMDVDNCESYPSHEVIFRNPKRMAMRDLELFSERFALVYAMLAENRSWPMRVLDLAWGGEEHAPIWKLNTSKHRLVLAHDEASAYVQDLVAFGDLREVEPERYVWTGRMRLRDRVEGGLEAARLRYGHLEFRSRGLEADQALAGSGEDS